MTQTVGIVGGGIFGTTLALRLAQAGVDVELLERAPTIGGLADRMDLGGYQVDRFYHVIVPTDERMLGLVDELGLTDQLGFNPVGVGFWIDGKMEPFNGIGDFLRFSPLSLIDRFKLGMFVLRCQRKSSYDDLEDVPLLPWLEKQTGKNVVRKIWKPLLDSRFDGKHDELPATYLWARTRRMNNARQGKSRAETMGALRGGHQTLIEAAAKAAEAAGAKIRTGVPVTGLTMEGGAVTGVATDDGDRTYDLTIPTLQPPGLKFLLPEPLKPLLDLYPQRYQGVVCLVLLVKHSLIEHYSVNITDETPITTVVETSHAVGTEHTGGHRLVYVPKYCDTASEAYGLSDQEVYDRFTAKLAQLSPQFRHEDVLAWTVQHGPTVEPVHPMGKVPRVPPFDRGVDGLMLASAAQVYPRLLNGESVIDLAEDVAKIVAARVKASA
ncbi:MAG: FAD-dependent oxidoreductase [Solirubrobacteraceae bacterium]|nr:FAD-dependent oxidoreductase [Patulibacter sp.]